MEGHSSQKSPVRLLFSNRITNTLSIQKRKNTFAQALDSIAST